MTANSFRQLSVRCDFSEKKLQLHKQLSVDAGFERWGGEERQGAGRSEEKGGKRNLEIFLARDAVASGPLAPGMTSEEVSAIPPPSAGRPRPASAAARRQGFQKRLSSAFHGAVKPPPKPPLERAASAPCRPAEQRRPKFVSRQRAAGTGRSKEADAGVGARREACRLSPLGFCDVETMISLMSPSGSDCEDSGIIKPEKNGCPVLPKEEKSVSFQQSSIHSVRSFSASFPARRGSSNHRVIRHRMRSSSQEKTESIENKRLNSTTMQRRLSKDQTSEPSREVQGVESPKVNSNGLEATNIIEAVNVSNEGVVGPSLDTFGPPAEIDHVESPKERQCRHLYSKITKNGINVSFDTILRGILTPTEYRTRQTSLNMSSMISDEHN